MPDETSSCPLYDRLFGSRVLVASAELRAPLWGLFKGRLGYGPLPLEIALFADAGVAWTGGQKASFLGGDRSLLTSVGAARRANVFGFLVAQISAAKPLDRPGRKGWVWQWSLSPVLRAGGSCSAARANSRAPRPPAPSPPSASRRASRRRPA